MAPISMKNNKKKYTNLNYSSNLLSTSFSTPLTSPSLMQSINKNSFYTHLAPIPSTSSQSGVSFQSFHTALDESEDEEQPILDFEAKKKRKPLQINLSSRSTPFNRSELNTATGNIPIENSYHYSLLTPMTARSGESFFIHPMSLIQSSAGLTSNFYYYNNLDSGSLAKSPVGSYFQDYQSDDYEVVLDDGKKHKRSVSLSTIPTALDITKKKYKANFNPHYFDEINNGKLENQNPYKNRQNQPEKFYDHLLEEERRNFLNTKLTKHPNEIIHELQETESSDDEMENDYYHRSSKSCYTQLKHFHDTISSYMTLSYRQKMVLKCSFAYLIGSLFTFVPFLNNMLRTARLSSHVIATVTVFFNPTKTVGGMVEAIIYGLVYTLCGLVVSLMSMAVALFLRAKDYYFLSCCVTLGFWLAGSTFLISFIKAKYNKPTIATGCGLFSMIIFPVLVKEGSEIPADFDTTYIEVMSAIVIIGSAISAFICWFIWPVSATTKLKTDINDTLGAIKILLKLLTKTFLLDKDLPEFTANESLQSAINSHQTSFTALQSSLTDAKNEFYNFHIRKHAEEYDDVVLSLQRLAQHIGGLRSSCGLQFEVMKTTKSKSGTLKGYGTMQASDNRTDGLRSRFPKKKKLYNVTATEQRKKFEYELKKEQTLSSQSIADSDPLDEEGEPETQGQTNTHDKEGAVGQFIKTVRPPMKSLAFTCKQTIVHLQSHFTNQTNDKTPSFDLLRQNLTMALALFEESQQLALIRLYHRKMKNSSPNKAVNKDINHQELLSHLMTEFPAEDVFLVYFFVFCLIEFTKELTTLVESVQSIYEYDEEQRNQNGFFGTLKVHMANIFWFFCCCFYKESVNETLYKSTVRKSALSKKMSVESFVPNNNNTFNTLHTPKPKTKIRKFLIGLWDFFSKFKQHSVRYAIKSTLITLAIASMAFIPATKEYFSTFKMDWMLITVMAVMTPTVGGTNQVAILRVFATIVGSMIATLFFLLFPTNGSLLLFLSWAFSIPCFWMILYYKHGRFGMFSLLSYNLIVPFMYNHKNEEEVIDVAQLAFMRCGTVSAGVIIGLIVTAYIWPYEARKEMRKGLSDLLIQLSWLYKQLVSEYSEDSTLTLTRKSNTSKTKVTDQSLQVKQNSSTTNPTQLEHENPSIALYEELVILAQRNEVRSIQFQQMELSLQLNLLNLRDLLVHAPNEPRLKGPFPTKTYEAMLTSCQNILDKFLSIRIVIMKDIWATQVRKDLFLPVSHELMDMAGSVLLYFYLLASALQLKTPLPPSLPPAEKAREMLMLKLQQLPKLKTDAKNLDLDSSQKESIKEECYMVYYAYVVMMESIIIELDKLGKQMKELFGSLVPDDQWRKCFGLTDLEENTRAII